MSDDRRLQVLRSIDKLDRLGPLGVYDLLTTGRRDESGAWTDGCGLSKGQALFMIMFLTSGRLTEEQVRIHDGLKSVAYA